MRFEDRIIVVMNQPTNLRLTEPIIMEIVAIYPIETGTMTRKRIFLSRIIYLCLKIFALIGDLLHRMILSVAPKKMTYRNNWLQSK